MRRERFNCYLTEKKNLIMSLIRAAWKRPLFFSLQRVRCSVRASRKSELERASKVGVSHLEVVCQLAENLDRGLVHDLLSLLDFRGEDCRERVSDVERARLFRALGLHHPVQEHTVHVRGC